MILCTVYFISLNVYTINTIIFLDSVNNVLTLFGAMMPKQEMSQESPYRLISLVNIY